MNIDEIRNLQPDDKGIITVEIDGVQRRFVKEKLICHLTGEKPKLEPVKIKVKKEKKIPPPKKERKPAKIKVRK